MRYLEDGAAREDVSSVFLPARAASFAMALSSTASFVAVVFLARLTVDAPLETGHIVLVASTAAAFLTFVCTSLITAYARFLPPPTTRIWDLVRGIVSYLAVLWVVCLGLSGAVLGEVLLPLKSCTGPYPSLCLTELQSHSTRIIAVLSVALAASLALCVLVTLDLRSTHPHARVVILRAELAAQRARATQARRVRALQQALETPLLRAEGLERSADEDDRRAWLGGAGAGREASRRATVSAYAARARLPVDDPEAAWLSSSEPLGPPVALAARRPVIAPSPSRKDALGVPLMFSPGKRHRHPSRRREAPEEEEHQASKPPRRHHARGRAAGEAVSTDDETSSSGSDNESAGGTSTTSSSEDAPRARARRTSHRPRHAAPPSPPSTSTSSSSTDNDGTTTEEHAPGKRHHRRAGSSRRQRSSAHRHEHKHGQASGHRDHKHRCDDEHPHERRRHRHESDGDSQEDERRRRREKREQRKRDAEARTADVNASRMETASAGAADAA
ncbi:hypothetical protein JCM3775_006941 [Rhodotorula graminis]|uniref:Uncharacterized protein n=1 Tax=Rhodotorula graminis (strain WP1) TaxID=578459 RepID=A0A194SG06_RHOGW|nr:uncharacterized protein RHOBADRAFT_41111 [Rhodotorula graminis WP1]KPV78566.1 hypothetical protein RHOBADRAFT_41111 [Rhodotorula graminis WP1]